VIERGGSREENRANADSIKPIAQIKAIHLQLRNRRLAATWALSFRAFFSLPVSCRRGFFFVLLFGSILLRPFFAAFFSFFGGCFSFLLSQAVRPNFLLAVRSKRSVNQVFCTTA